MFVRTEGRLHLGCWDAPPGVGECAVIRGGRGRGRGRGRPRGPSAIALLYGVGLLGLHHRLLDLDSIKYEC
jgi:hypothetical protein